MTDNEIVKALECCARSECADCKNCPLDSLNRNDCYSIILHQHSLDLINRQKAEIERLKNAVPSNKYACRVAVKNGVIYTHTLEDYEWLIGDIGEEAIKEFAERLKSELTPYPECEFKETITSKQIDNLVKEMTEDCGS